VILYRDAIHLARRTCRRRFLLNIWRFGRITLRFGVIVFSPLLIFRNVMLFRIAITVRYRALSRESTGLTPRVKRRGRSSARL
jgi:hypothetical protein